MSQAELPSEGVKFLYALHKKLSKNLRETLTDYTPEEAFWMVFAAVAVHPWQDEGQYEVRLSELLRLYLTIYCEQLNPTLAVQDEPDFLEHLRKKFYAVKEIVLQSEDIEDVPRKLCLWLHGSAEEGNIVRSVAGTVYITKMANAENPLPFRFVQDV